MEKSNVGGEGVEPSKLAEVARAEVVALGTNDDGPPCINSRRHVPAPPTAFGLCPFLTPHLTYQLYQLLHRRAQGHQRTTPQ